MNQWQSCSLSALLTLALAFWASGQERATSPAKLPAGSTQQTILILTEERPLLVQVHVLLNGRPLVEHWQERTQTLFRFLDTDKDGALSRDESSRLLLLGAFAVNVGLPVDDNKDGKISLEEFRQWLLESNYGPLHVSRYPAMSGLASAPFDQRVFTVGGPLSVRLALKLFSALDRNGDGKLDARELEQSEELLRSLDEDEDELVTANEVFNSTTETSPESAAAKPLGAPGSQFLPASQSRLLIISSQQSRENAVRSLQMLYSQENVAISRRRLRSEDIHLPAEVFRRFDKDGDGWLDAEEIHGFLMSSADVEVVLRLDEPANLNQPPRVRFLEASARSGCQVTRTDEEVTLGSDRARVHLSARAWLTEVGQRRFASHEAAKANFLETNLKNALRVFMQVDADQNGYLNENEFRRLPLTLPWFRGVTFARLDRNGDGMLVCEEYEAYLREGLEILFLARDMGLSLNLTQQGPALFGVLDTNRDGKLGVREWRRAPGLLRSLDRNGDGVLDWTELVAHYQVDIGVAETSSEAGRMFAGRPTQVPPSRPAEVRAAPNVPVWFRAMDRNGDGDVSRREFPGSDAEFRRLDINGDGLISLDEAMAASKSLPPVSVPQPARKP